MTLLDNFDLTPFYRNSIGVDRLLDTMQNHLNANQGNYPPYNIISVDEDKYIIELAVAGFSEDDINVTAHDGNLVIRGEMSNKADESNKNYFHHGISKRKFKREFQLADYVEVQSADLKDGILRINLKRIIPDSLKPKEIKVNASNALPSDDE